MAKDEIDPKYVFQIDTTQLDYQMPPVLLGRLVGRIIEKAADHKDERPERIRIVVGTLHHEIAGRDKVLVAAKVQDVMADGRSKSRTLLTAYNLAAEAVMQECGENMEFIINEAKVWNPSREGDGSSD